MSKRFEVKIKELLKKAEETADPNAIYKLNLALLRSNKVDPNLILKDADKIIEEGDAALPLVEILLEHDDPYYSYGVEILELMDTPNARKKLKTWEKRAANPTSKKRRNKKQTNKDLYKVNKSANQLRKANGLIRSDKVSDRRKGIKILGESFDLQVEPILINLAFSDPDDRVREDALWWYAYQKAEDNFYQVMTYVQRFFDSDYQLKGLGLGPYWAAVVELGKYNTPEAKSAIPHFCNLVSNAPDWSTRKMSIDILSYLNAGFGCIKEALNDPSPNIRQLAARVLGEVQFKSAQSKIEEMAKKDKSKKVRTEAKKALKTFQESH